MASARATTCRSRLSLYLVGAGVTVAVSFVMLAAFMRSAPGSDEYWRFDVTRTALRTPARGPECSCSRAARWPSRCTSESLPPACSACRARSRTSPRSWSGPSGGWAWPTSRRCWATSGPSSIRSTHCSPGRKPSARASGPTGTLVARIALSGRPRRLARGRAVRGLRVDGTGVGPQRQPGVPGGGDARVLGAHVARHAALRQGAMAEARRGLHAGVRAAGTLRPDRAARIEFRRPHALPAPIRRRIAVARAGACLDRRAGAGDARRRVLRRFHGNAALGGRPRVLRAVLTGHDERRRCGPHVAADGRRDRRSRCCSSASTWSSAAWSPGAAMRAFRTHASRACSC